MELRPTRVQARSRGVELDPQESPREIKSWEMKLDSHRELDNSLLRLFLKSCFSDTVFVTLFRTAVETALSEVHKLFCTSEIPTSLTLLFWRWLMISTVFTGRNAQTSYSLVSPLTHSFPVPKRQIYLHRHNKVV